MYSSIASSEALKLKSQELYLNDSHVICADKWTKRGELDNRMYNHCMKGQMEGYEEVKTYHQYVDQKFYSQIAYPYCSKKWTKRAVVDTRMLAYCLNQEIEGIKDVMYYREQYSSQQVNSIVGKAISQYGSWNMAAYKVKNAIK
jgi:Zn-finger nucleic acid-binding protein